MAEINAENPWIFGAAGIGLWIALSVLFGHVFFGGDLLRAVLQGFVGGLAFVIVYLLVQRTNSE